MAQKGNPLLTKGVKAAGPIGRYRIAAFDGEGRLTQATDPKDALVGVADLGAVRQGQICDVHLAGIVAVEYGGAVAHGDWLTTDDQGRAVKADGGDKRAIGLAWIDGVAGDHGLAFLAPQQTKG